MKRFCQLNYQELASFVHTNYLVNYICFEFGSGDQCSGPSVDVQIFRKRDRGVFST